MVRYGALWNLTERIVWLVGNQVANSKFASHGAECRGHPPISYQALSSHHHHRTYVSSWLAPCWRHYKAKWANDSSQFPQICRNDMDIVSSFLNHLKVQPLFEMSFLNLYREQNMCHWARPQILAHRPNFGWYPALCPWGRQLRTQIAIRLKVYHRSSFCEPSNN